MTAPQIKYQSIPPMSASSGAAAGVSVAAAIADESSAAGTVEAASGSSADLAFAASALAASIMNIGMPKAAQTLTSSPRSAPGSRASSLAMVMRSSLSRKEQAVVIDTGHSTTSVRRNG